MTQDDLEQPIHAFAEKMHFTEPTRKIWLKIDPHYPQKTSRSMILLSRNVRYMQIFARVSRARGIKWQWQCSCRWWHFFGHLAGYFLGKFRKGQHYDMVTSNPLLACNWLQNEWPRMTMSGYFMSNSAFVPAGLDSRVWLSKIIVCKVINRDPYYQRQTCWPITLVSIFNTKAVLSQ